MDELIKPFPQEQYDNVWPGRWTDRRVLLVLILIAIVLRLVVIWQTEVPARDSIGFIELALRLESGDWGEVLRKNHHPPGFPVAILVMAWGVHLFSGIVDCYTMQLSAQLVSALAGVLLVFPMYYLGKLLFCRSVGFWATLLFQCMPTSGHLLSDGISESLFLFVLLSGVLAGVLAITTSQLWKYAVVGLLAGLSYLVRPEGLLLVAVMCFVLLLMQMSVRWHRPWRKAISCGAVMVVCTCLVGVPYVLTIGRLSNKPTAGKLGITPPAPPRQGHVAIPNQDSDNSRRAGAVGYKPILFANLFAARVVRHDDVPVRAWNAVTAVIAEQLQILYYWAWVPGLVSLIWCYRNYRYDPRLWVTFLLFFIHMMVAWLLAFKVGYVSSRHLLVPGIMTLLSAMAAMCQLTYRLRQWNPAGLARLLFTDAGVVLMAAGLIAGLCKTLEPLHENREGHHEAGKWLARHAQPADIIQDDHCWAHYYAGHVFHDIHKTPAPAGYLPKHFVVYSRPHSRRKPTTPRRYEEDNLIARGAEIVFRWPQHAADDEARVIVFQLGKSKDE